MWFSRTSRRTSRTTSRIFVVLVVTSVSSSKENNETKKLQDRGRRRCHVSEGCRIQNFSRSAYFLARKDPLGIQESHCSGGRIVLHRKRHELEQHRKGEHQDPDLNERGAKSAELAQLHQLRGRVGRGDKQSYCIMVNASGNQEKNRRLEVLNKSNDGFYIASEDLKLRGPGDLFGIRQSGDLEFQLADIYTDAVTLKKVSEDVNRLLTRDENLEEEENRELKKRLDRFMEEKYEKLNL